MLQSPRIGACFAIGRVSGLSGEVMGKHEIVAHISEAPTVEISDGVVHVRDRSGGVRIDRAMSVKILTKYVARGKRALERYAQGEQNVIVDD